MKHLTLTAFRHSLTQALRDVEDSRTELIVTRATGDPLVVLRLDDYQALKDMTSLLSSDLGRGRLDDAIRRRTQEKAPLVLQRTTPG